KKAVEEGKISQGHARQLLSLSEEKQAEWIQIILEKDLSVHALEKVLSNKKKKQGRQNNPFLKEQEVIISQHLGTTTKILQKKKWERGDSDSF
ncbi:chromosome partitioning protein ParB, partial [Streptococcus ruminantium]|nr:chromosome partitioning protein ParB [Streptococcus ruminantium]